MAGGTQRGLGKQYADGSSPSTIKGVPTMWNDAGALRVPSATKPLPTNNADIGAKADSEATTDNGTFSLIALFKRLLSRVTTIINSVATEATLSAINGKLSDFSGTWGYTPGSGSGTIVLSGGKRVLQISIICLEGPGTLEINGGGPITIPYGPTDKVSSDFVFAPIGNLVDPTIVYTGADSIVVEHLTN